MKKKLLSIICFLASIAAVPAQTLYSTTQSGGTNTGGTTFCRRTAQLTVISTLSVAGRQNIVFILLLFLFISY